MVYYDRFNQDPTIVEDAVKDDGIPELTSGTHYDRETAVSFETWQTELAFDRLDGSARETKARNSNDAFEQYQNYVTTWEASDIQTRYSIDRQHGFYSGSLYTPEGEGGGGGGGGGTSNPTPDPEEAPDDPTPEEISPEPADDSTNDGSDNTQEDNNTVIESEVVNDDGVDPSQDPDTNDADDSLLTVRDVTPQDEVVDPATGKRFPSSEDARRAGITNWVYAYKYDSENSGG